jgi:hypothetical protein
MGLTNYSLLTVLITHLQMFTVRRLAHGVEEKGIGGFMLFFLGFGGIYLIMNSFAGPNLMPNLTLPSSYEITPPPAIDSRFLEFDGYFDIFDIIIREDITPCGASCS